MNLSPDATRYLVWAGVVVLGMALAVFDRQVLRRWLFGILLAAGVAGGLALTVVSPFSFGAINYYMEGVIISAGSALALIGYVIAVLARFLVLRLST
ncbi:MAG: hypothetical protein ABL907_12510 [Hyphomicrobium sp.]